jgi:hypothetical protein
MQDLKIRHLPRISLKVNTESSKSEECLAHRKEGQHDRILFARDIQAILIKHRKKKKVDFKEYLQQKKSIGAHNPHLQQHALNQRLLSE